MKIISGFSKLSKTDKIEWLASHMPNEHANMVRDMKIFWHQNPHIQKRFDEFSENTLTNYYMPFGIAPNFLINNKLYAMPISVEHVFRGKHITEYSLGASYLLEAKTPSRLTASVLMGLSPGGKLDYQIDPAIDSRLNLGVNIDNLNSLDGERNIVSLKSGNVYPSFYLKGTKYF